MSVLLALSGENGKVSYYWTTSAPCQVPTTRPLGNPRRPDIALARGENSGYLTGEAMMMKTLRFVLPLLPLLLAAAGLQGLPRRDCLPVICLLPAICAIYF